MFRFGAKWQITAKRLPPGKLIYVKAGKLTSICLATDKLINCCSQSGYPFMVYGFEVSFVVQTASFMI